MTRLKLKLIIALLIMVSISGCGSTQSVPVESNQERVLKGMNTFIGHTKKQLLLQYGAPQSVTSDGDGGEIVTYIDVKSAYFNNLGYVSITHKYFFYVNSENVIYYCNYIKSNN